MKTSPGFGGDRVPQRGPPSYLRSKPIMEVPMWESRIAPLSGVVAVVLIALSAVLVNNYEFMPPEEEVASFYAGDSLRIMVGAYCGALSAFFFLWFAGSVRRSVRSISDRLGDIAFGGGVLAAAMIAGGYLLHTAGAERAMLHDVIDSGAAAALFDLSSLAVGTGAALGFAGLIGGFAVAAMREKRFPRWLTWASAVTALGLVSPVNYIFIALAIIWVPVVAVILYRSERTAASTEPTAIAV